MQRKRRKTKNLVIVFALIIACIYVGYSLITSNLQVRTSLDVAKTSFDVHFENLRISKESTIETLPTLSDDKTDISFNVTLNVPGDSYILNTDIYNAGTIDAAIGEITLEGLDETSSNHIDTAIIYSLDNKPLAVDDVIKAGETDTILIKVMYKYSSENSNEILLDQALNVSLTLNIEYVKPTEERLQNGEYNIRPFNAYNYIFNKSVLDNGKSRYVTSSDGIDFSLPSSNTNGKGIYTVSSTINDTFPINYYRGNVVNNNVIINNYCWKIVRTTETGGIKLIFSGYPNSNGTCGDPATITSDFNTSYNYDSNDNAYIGYWYGEVESSSYNSTHSNTNKSVIADKLQKFFNKGNDKLNIYCDNPDIDLNQDYVSEFNKEQLEESNYCNDRSIASDITSIDEFTFNNLGYGNNNTVYSGYKRLTQTFNPTFNCDNTNDIFTDYVGLLTLDEAMYAGLVKSERTANYLNLGSSSGFFLMTPVYYADGNAYMSYVDDGAIYYEEVNNDSEMRPVITLNNDVKFYSGDGTPNNPFTVYNSAIYEIHHPLV